MLIAIVFGAVFVWLGLWQLERLEARRADGRAASERLTLPPVDLNAWLAGRHGLAGDSTDLLWRRVQFTGQTDYRNDIVLRGRSRDGVPGIHVATPVLIQTGAGLEAVVVVRGWLPAPDAMRADLSAARSNASPPNEGPLTVTLYLTGIVVPTVKRQTIPPLRIDFGGEEHTVLAAPDLSDIREALPYPVAPILVQWTARGEKVVEAGGGWSSPAVLPPPAFDDGPHLMYAIQWFAFAAISLVGGIAFLRRGR